VLVGTQDGFAVHFEAAVQGINAVTSALSAERRRVNAA
jgi:hypothetical protein